MKENYFDKGITDEVAFRVDFEPRQFQVTTADLAIAMERLRTGHRRTDTVPTVGQMRNATDIPVGTDANTGNGTVPGPD